VTPHAEAPRPPAAAARSDEYRYRAVAGPGAEELCVEVDLPAGSSSRTWAGDPPLHAFVRDMAIAEGGVLRPVPAGHDGWLVPACGTGCRLRYRVLLGDAGRALEDFDRSMVRDGAILAPPSAWMLRPQQVSAPFLLEVTTALGESFVTGLALAGGGTDTHASTSTSMFRGDVGALDETPYAAFGRFPVTRKTLPGGLVDVAFFRAKAAPAVEAWVDHALSAVTAYYRRFPIEHAALVVRVGPGSGVSGGHTMGSGGGAVLISVGEHSDAAALADDWVLVHELVHVSFPNVSSPWAEEGLATYLEPIIRVRSGLCDADEVWRSLVDGLPQGQPEDGDGGLDVTDTWGRRYWGGALFWFVADVEIRKVTGNARSLDDALRAVNDAGGNVSKRWDLDRVLALADAATGVEVLGPLRRKWGKTPVRVDLDAMWKSLGVAQAGGKMRYDDGAPLAALRRGILAGRAPTAPPKP
jgi:hypothetical protein